MIKNITIETENIKHFFHVTISFFADLLILGLILFFLLFYNFQTTIFAVAIILILFFLNIFFLKPLFIDWGQMRLKFQGIINKVVSESFFNIKIIKLWALESSFLKVVNDTNIKRANLIKNLNIFHGLPKIIIELILVMIFSIFFIYSLLNGTNTDEIILNLSIYGVSFFKIIPSINNIISSYSTLKFYTPSAKAVYNEICSYSIENISHFQNLNINENQISRNSNNHEKMETFQFTKSIEFRDVDFSYEVKSKKILEKINLKINAGDKIGVFGPSGSGKSTFVDLVLKLIEPTNGKIYVDDIDITNKNFSWKKKAGYIQQNTFLFDDTLINNINLEKFINPNVATNNPDIKKTLKISKVENFLKLLPEGLNTIVGDKGIKLSGGQKQRVAIARAIYNNPDLLILDESTNQLDSEIEKELLDDFFEAFVDKTILVISHDFKVFKNCNRIFYFDNGTIFEK